MIRRVRRGLAAVAAAVFVSLALIPATPVAVHSQEPVPARECCLPLLFTIGARALSLGDAISARSSPDGLFANPALVAAVVDDQFVVYNTDTPIETSNTFSFLVNSEVAGTFGLAYRLVDFGEQEARDGNGNLVGTISNVSHILTATYATAVVAGFNAGVSYKLYQSRRDCQGFCGVEAFSATTHGLDLGVQYLPRALPALQLGAALVHMGFPLQVVNKEQAAPLPFRIRFGGAYEVGHHFQADSAIAVRVSSDVVAGPRDSRFFINMGVELALDDAIFVRAGYGGVGGPTSGAAAGVAVRYDRFDVGVAKSFVTDPLADSEPVQITFAIRF